MDIAKQAAGLPKYEVSLHITHNRYKSHYLSVVEYLAEDQHVNPDGYDPDEWISRADFDYAISTNSLWEIQWYPNTPDGFYLARGSTLENALRSANEVEST